MPPCEKNFGLSLIGGYCDHYVSDFALHGTVDAGFRSKLLPELQSAIEVAIGCCVYFCFV